ncbi:MAG: SAM-dependent chlorinase/fluorinase, partial [Elusimicrobiota bacterium]|nr:SAM-dependent chlorinase/fluorinase [Elusimicrobiota bacterium]
WTAARRGHCNVNDMEMRKAVRALEDWLETGRKPADEKISIEISRVNSAVRYEKGRVYGRISRVDQAYGNLTADVTRADLEKAGIKQDAYLNVGLKEKKFRVFLGYHYADVEKGKWVAFLTAEDYLQIAMNWANAQKELGCKEGDEVFLESDSTIKK